MTIPQTFTKSSTGPSSSRSSCTSCAPPNTSEQHTESASDEGAAAIWVVVFSAVFMLVIGVLVDVGTAVTRKQEISRTAAEAARFGIDELGKLAYRQGGQPGPAAIATVRREACAWATQREQNTQCVATWTGTELAVELTTNYQPQFPLLRGVMAEEIRAQSSARAELGV